MNIVYLIPSLCNAGGMERILTEKVNFLVDAYAFDVTIITTEQDNRPIYFKLDKRVRVINFDLNFNQSYDKHIFVKFFETHKLLKTYRRNLLKFLSNNVVDVCISLGGKELEFFYKLKTECKKICEMHFSKGIRQQFLLSRQKSFLWKLIGAYRTKQLIKQTKSLDRLVVLTKRDLEDWQKTHVNVSQIYNFSPIDTSNRSSLTNKEVIAIGRLDPQKGFDILIDVWKNIVERGCDDWTLNIVGEGIERSSLEKRIEINNLSKHVILQGVSDDIENKLLESSIYILPSRYEGFPMVLLESLSCGVPSVCFDGPTGASEVIDENDCGFLVTYLDEKMLKEKVLELINNYDLRKLMGAKAKNKSLIFSKTVIMKQWFDLLSSFKIK